MPQDRRMGRGWHPDPVY